MQTFLPYADFRQSARSLDRMRLGKQRVETLQIVRALTVVDYGWQNHPAVKMWRGHLPTLLRYQIAICSEWTSRGYKDTCLQKAVDSLEGVEGLIATAPAWLGNEALHLSHRSNLLRKSPEHYAERFEEGLRQDLEYVWPV
jgi:hypothetical protein